MKLKIILAQDFMEIFFIIYVEIIYGYWDIFDPINGFTAIKADVLKKIKMENLDNRYFFETDMLFNLYLINVRVKDIPVDIKYHKNQVQI